MQLGKGHKGEMIPISDGVYTNVNCLHECVNSTIIVLRSIFVLKKLLEK